MHSGFRQAKIPQKNCKPSDKRSCKKKSCRCGSDKKKSEKYGKKETKNLKNILPHLKE